MMWVVGDDADRTPLDTGQRRDHSEAKIASEFGDGIDVEQAIDDTSDVIGPKPVERHDIAQHFLIR